MLTFGALNQPNIMGKNITVLCALNHSQHKNLPAYVEGMFSIHPIDTRYIGFNHVPNLNGR